MKHSVRGTIRASDHEEFLLSLRGYILWRLDSTYNESDADGQYVTFEIWLDNKNDQQKLFKDLKKVIYKNNKGNVEGKLERFTTSEKDDTSLKRQKNSDESYGGGNIK